MAAMGVNFHQVVAMTYEEQVAAYQKLTKAELINMLIECNRLLSAYAAASNNVAANQFPRKICDHQWLPLPSITTGERRFQCFKCGAHYSSLSGEQIVFFSRNSN